MSHTVSVRTQMINLPAIGAACSKLGLVLKEGQSTYKSWRGNLKCDHVIAVEGASSSDYELGLAKEGASEEFTLKHDFYGQHTNRLAQMAGQNFDMLTQRYAVEVARQEAEAKGFSCFETQEEDQSITLQVQVGVG